MTYTELDMIEAYEAGWRDSYDRKGRILDWHLTRWLGDLRERKVKT